jgi:hypothetical protein
MCNNLSITKELETSNSFYDDTCEGIKKKKNTNKSGSELSFYAQAFQIFKDRKSLADVAIELDIKTDVVLDFYRDYLILIRMNGLVDVYQDLKNDFPFFYHLYRRVKKEGLDKQHITDLLDNQNKLSELEERVALYNSHFLCS